MMSARKLVDRMLEGDRRAVSRIISAVENRTEHAAALMKMIYPHTGNAAIIGLTGAGGSGKSTLMNRLIGRFRQHQQRVGVVAVDPSSPFSGGAVLADRIRFQEHALDEGVYIRSMAARGFLGGLARTTNDVVRIMEAMGNDVVLIETLGAGQDEIDIVNVAQTCMLVLTPGMGDDIQAMKAGILEIADIIILNKADQEGATTMMRILESAVINGRRSSTHGWTPPVIPTVAVNHPKHAKDSGIDALFDAIIAHKNFLAQTETLRVVQNHRIEHELRLILKDEIETRILTNLKDKGQMREYVESLRRGEKDPYSVIDEVIGAFLKQDAVSVSPQG